MRVEGQANTIGPGPRPAPTLGRRAVIVGAAGLLGLVATGCRPRPPALAGPSALVPPAPLPAPSTPPAPSPVALGPALDRSGWLPLVGSVVSLRGPAGSVDAEVAEVVDLVGAEAGAAGCFSVLLHLGAGPAPGSDVVTVSRPGADDAELLACPVDSGRSVRCLQIIVNVPDRPQEPS